MEVPTQPTPPTSKKDGKATPSPRVATPQRIVKKSTNLHLDLSKTRRPHSSFGTHKSSVSNQPITPPPAPGTARKRGTTWSSSNANRGSNYPSGSRTARPGSASSNMMGRVRPQSALSTASTRLAPKFVTPRSREFYNRVVRRPPQKPPQHVEPSDDHTFYKTVGRVENLCKLNETRDFPGTITPNKFHQVIIQAGLSFDKTQRNDLIKLYETKPGSGLVDFALLMKCIGEARGVTKHVATVCSNSNCENHPRPDPEYIKKTVKKKTDLDELFDEFGAARRKEIKRLEEKEKAKAKEREDGQGGRVVMPKLSVGSVTFRSRTKPVANAKNLIHSCDHLNLSAISHSNSGDYHLAIEAYNKALVMNQYSDVALINRGCCFEALGKHTEALADFTTAAKHYPREPIAYYNRCVAFFNLGKISEATSNINKAIELDPKDPELYKGRAFLLRSQGHFHRSGLDYSEAWANMEEGEIAKVFEIPYEKAMREASALEHKKLRRALSRPSYKRSDRDIELMIKFFALLPFFAARSPSIHVDLARTLVFERREPGEPVYHQNEAANHVYIILKGKVSVVRRGEGSVAPLSVKLCTVGMTLGEEALEATPSERTDTATAVDQVDMMAFYREDVDAVVEKHTKDEREEKIQFFRNLPILRNMDMMQVRAIANASEKKKFGPGDPIVAQGGVPDFMHFILSGTAKVIVEVEQVTPQGLKKKTVDFMTLRSQDYCGEIAILDPFNRTHRATTVCKTHVQTLAIHKTDYKLIPPAIFRYLKAQDEMFPDKGHLLMLAGSKGAWEKYKENFLGAVVTDMHNKKRK